MASKVLTKAQADERRGMARLNADHTETALLEFQSPTAALIATPVPWSARVTTYAIFSLLMISIVLLSVLRVDRVVSAPGQLVSHVANVVIQPLETSIVRAVHVTEGQVVHKGDLLAELDPTFAGGDDRSTTAQAASLRAEVNRLRAELAGTAYVPDAGPYGQLQYANFQARRDQLRSHMQNYAEKIASLKSKVDQTQANASNARQRLVGLRDAEARRRELERLQVGSHLNTLAAIDARQQMEGQLSDAENATRGAAQDLAAMMSEAQNFAQQWRADTYQTLTTQGRTLADMEGQASKNTLRRKLLEIRAPEDAVVLSVAHVSVGTVMQSGDLFLTLVPIDAPLDVDASIPATDTGFVHVGDVVSIKFDTLPYSTYGYALGKVETISPDSFSDPTQGRTLSHPDLQFNSSSNVPGAVPLFYRARISVGELRLRNLPRGFHLVPGMPVANDILVGKRTVVQYLFSRFMPTATEGMQEP